MKGWIIYHRDNKRKLIDLGVKLTGIAVADDKDCLTLEQHCEMTEKVFLELGSHWGQFIWGLE